jgi:hypothetical protein
LLPTYYEHELLEALALIDSATAPLLQVHSHALG